MEPPKKSTASLERTVRNVPTVHSKLVRDDTSDYNNTIIFKRRVSACIGSIQQSL